MEMGKHELLELKAYYIWEQEGRPQGRALDNWLTAERTWTDDELEFEQHYMEDVKECVAAGPSCS